MICRAWVPALREQSGHSPLTCPRFLLKRISGGHISTSFLEEKKKCATKKFFNTLKQLLMRKIRENGIGLSWIMVRRCSSRAVRAGESQIQIAGVSIIKSNR